MMRRFRPVTVLVGVLLLAVGAPGIAHAQAPTVDGPIDLVGELGGAPFEIRVPAEWNGTLVVYAHGYRDKADHPGEVDNRSADAFVADPFEEVLLAEGFALAGSAYQHNGWAIKEGVHDTNRLVRHFGAVVGRPDTTILVGFSMGSVITFEAIERFAGLYDGAIPSCAVGSGAPRAFDGTMAINAAYDATFGWPEAWGTPGDVRDDIDFESEVLPVFLAELAAPSGAAKLEFMRRATGVPQGPEWPFSPLFFSTEGRAELERRAHGPVVQNLDHTYSLTDADRAAIEALGATPEQIDGWLATMDAVRADAPRSSRNYVIRYADYTGRLRRPVLTLHTVVDALVPPAHIDRYNRTVAAAGRSDHVVNAWTSGVGHCNFTPGQTLTAITAMQEWIDTGDAPDPASFPAEEGFVPFTPPPWPQP